MFPLQVETGELVTWFVPVQPNFTIIIVIISSIVVSAAVPPNSPWLLAEVMKFACPYSCHPLPRTGARWRKFSVPGSRRKIHVKFPGPEVGQRVENEFSITLFGVSAQPAQCWLGWWNFCPTHGVLIGAGWWWGHWGGRVVKSSCASRSSLEILIILTDLTYFRLSP